MRKWFRNLRNVEWISSLAQDFWKAFAGLGSINMAAWVLDSEILFKILVLVLSGFSFFLIISGTKGQKSASDLGLSQEQSFELAKRRQAAWIWAVFVFGVLLIILLFRIVPTLLEILVK